MADPTTNVWDSLAQADTEAQDQAAVTATATEAAKPVGPELNVFDSLEQDDANQNAQLGSILVSSLSKDASRQAAVLDIARQTRQPADVVDASFDSMKRAAELTQYDPAAFRRDYPEFADLLREHPEVGSVALRDVSLFSKLMHYADEMWRFTKTHPLTVMRSNIARSWAQGEAATNPDGPLARLEPKFEPKPVPAPKQVFQARDPVADEEGLAWLPKAFWAAGKQGWKQIEYSQLGAQLMDADAAGLDTWPLEKKVTDLQNALTPRFYGQASPLSQAFIDAVETGASQVSTYAGMSAAAGIGAATGATLGALTTRSAKGAAEGARLGLKLAPVGAGLASFNLERGQAYLEYRAEKTDDGVPVDKKVAMGAAVAYGLLAAGVESLESIFDLKALGSIGEAAAAGSLKTVLQESLKDKSKRAILLRVGEAWLKKSAGEGGEEWVQQSLQALANWGARTVSAGELQSFDAAGALEDSYQAGRVGTISGGAAGAVESSVHAYTELKQRSMEIDHAARSGQLVQAIAQAAQAQTAKVASEFVAKLVERKTSATGEPVTSLYVDAGAFLQEAKRQGVEPAELARQTMGAEGPARVAAAAEAGGKIELSVDEYVGGFGQTDTGKALVFDTTDKPGRMTPREAMAARDQVEQESEQLAEQLLAEPKPGEQPAQPPSQAELRLVDAVKRQLQQTQIYSPADAERAVALTRAFLRTQAVRHGLDPDVLFAGYTLKVERALEVPGAAAAQGGGGDRPRGFNEFQRPESGPGLKARIGLNPDSDYTTFLHEMGHWFLEVLGDLAQREDAPTQAKDDWQTILGWMGTEDRTGIQREHHEKFARGWEKFLRDGKAPSPELRAAFDRFSIWLRKTYPNLQALDVQVSPEVQAAMDRMLASDEEIGAARRRAGQAQPAFATPEDAGLIGMDPADWEAYQASRARAEQAERRAAQIAELEARKRETEAWWREEKRKKKAEAEAAYDTHRLTLAWRYIRNGEINGEKMPNPPRLDRAEVEAAVGAEAAKRLHGVLKKNGEHIDDVATELGFQNGRAMLAAVLQHPSKEQWAEAQALQAMHAEHGDVVTERANLEKLIADAQHAQEGYGDQIMRELVALNAKTGTRSQSVEAIERAAKVNAALEHIGAASPARALARERRAAEQFAEAWAKRKYSEAREAKTRQLYNHFLYREFMRAEADRDRFERLAGELVDNKRRARFAQADQAEIEAGTRRTALLPIVDAVLERLGVRPQTPESRPFPGYAAVAGVLRELGVEPLYDEEVLAEVLDVPRRWQDLTVKQVREVNAALEQLKHGGTVAAEMFIQNRRRGYEEVAQQIAAEARSQPDLGLAPADEAWEAEKRRRKLTKLGLIASYMDPEEMFRRLGPTAHEQLFGRFLERLEVERKLAGEVLAEVLKLIDAMPPEMLERRYDAIDVSGMPIPERVLRNGATPRTREWAWMVFLNAANDSNMQRLLTGYEWTEPQVREFLGKTLTKQEADFLQGILNRLETLRPYMEETYRRVNGLPPGRVQARPFELVFADGTRASYPGGYFPVRNDPKTTLFGLVQEDTGIQDMRQSSKASLAKSFTQERAAQANSVINLQWSTVPAHILQVIHYAAFEEFVRDMNRLLVNPTMRETIQRRLGEPFEATLADWVKFVARARDDSVSPGIEKAADLVNGLRSRLVMGSLGYSVTASFPDVLNALQAVAAGDVSRESVSAALQKAFSGGYKEMRAEALAAENSEPQKRAENLRETLQHRLGELGASGNKSGAAKVVEGVRENAYIVQETIDEWVSTLVWWAAREDARAKAAEHRKEALARADAATARAVQEAEAKAKAAGPQLGTEEAVQAALAEAEAALQRLDEANTRGVSKAEFEALAAATEAAKAKADEAIAAREAAKTTIHQQARKEALAAEVIPEQGEAELAAERAANDVVRRSLPAATAYEQPALLRSRHGFGALLAMFGYFAKLGNIGLRLVASGETRGEKAASLARFIGVLAVANVAGSLIAGQGPEPGEDWSEWAIRKTVASPFLLVPFVGGFGEVAVGAGLSKLYHGKAAWRRANPLTAPALAALERVWGAYQKAAQARDPGKALASVAEGTAFLLKIPVTQPKRTFGFLYDVGSGHRQLRDPFDAASGFLYGDREKKAEDPFSALSKAVR